MKIFFLTLIFASSQLALAEGDFVQKIYTPEVVVDTKNGDKKGAVQLLWQKDTKPTRYEVEVSNGNLVYSQIGEKHFHHVMLYFNKNYQWRVREVSAVKTTEFSPWKPLKVVRANEVARNQKGRKPVSVDSENQVQEFLLDTGGQ